MSVPLELKCQSLSTKPTEYKLGTKAILKDLAFPESMCQASIVHRKINSSVSTGSQLHKVRGPSRRIPVPCVMAVLGLCTMCYVNRKGGATSLGKSQLSCLQLHTQVEDKQAGSGRSILGNIRLQLRLIMLLVVNIFVLRKNVNSETARALFTLHHLVHHGLLIAVSHAWHLTGMPHVVRYSIGWTYENKRGRH